MVVSQGQYRELNSKTGLNDGCNLVLPPTTTTTHTHLELPFRGTSLGMDLMAGQLW